MRRLLFFLMLITGILTIIVGIAEAQAWHKGSPVAHIVVASMFFLLCIIHLVLNRKAVVRYLVGKK